MPKDTWCLVRRSVIDGDAECVAAKGRAIYYSSFLVLLAVENVESSGRTNFLKHLENSFLDKYVLVLIKYAELEYIML